VIPCFVYDVLQKILQAYVAVLLLYAIVSWIPSLRGRWTDFLSMLVEPVLQPMRRVIPPLGGLDLSFLILIILVQWVSARIVPPACLFLS
jgi:YggT family protein